MQSRNHKGRGRYEREMIVDNEVIDIATLVYIKLY